MKHKTIWAISTLAVLTILAAGSYITYRQNQPQPIRIDQNKAKYDKLMNQAKHLVKEEEYAKAQAKFDDAYAVKQTKSASVYAKQAKDMTKALSYAKKGQFTKASSLAKSAIDSHGYWLLNDHAQRLINNLKTAEYHYEEDIQPLLKKAQDNESSGQIDEARNNYQAILDLSYIDQIFYQKYKTQAQDALERLKSMQESTSSSQSSTSSTATGTAGSTGAGAKGDHTVDGKTVTQPTIKEIKDRLNKLGYNANAWSPQDLIDLYRHAYENGHTSPDQITKEDVDSY